jgi:RNA recognition motif-containing protein
MKEQDIEDIFLREKFYPSKIRMLLDQDGKFKGAAFVEFEKKEDSESACRLNGKSYGNSDRRLRINPASNKPAPR